MCIHIYIYTHIHTANHHDIMSYVCCFSSRSPSPRRATSSSTVGFHNFNLRIFNLRVSNPKKLIVDVFVDTMSDFNVPGSRLKKHDDISEIDRTRTLSVPNTVCVDTQKRLLT